jgi:hypothetical protein
MPTAVGGNGGIVPGAVQQLEAAEMPSVRAKFHRSDTAGSHGPVLHVTVMGVETLLNGVN